MKTATVNVSFDEEKLSALRLYLEQKGLSLEDELVTALETMYSKNVPNMVKDFISMRSGILEATGRRKPKAIPDEGSSK